MNIWDAVVILLVAAALGLAVWRIIKNKSSGKGCCKDCSSCGSCCRNRRGSRE